MEKRGTSALVVDHEEPRGEPAGVDAGVDVLERDRVPRLEARDHRPLQRLVDPEHRGEHRGELGGRRRRGDEREPLRAGRRDEARGAEPHAPEAGRIVPREVRVPTDLRQAHPWQWRDDLILPALFAEVGATGVSLQVPEGSFYGFDGLYGGPRLDYQGPPFGWWDMTDEFTLAWMDELEMDRAPRKPPPEDAPGGPLSKEAFDARFANMGPPRRLIVWTHPRDASHPDLETAGNAVTDGIRTALAANARYVVLGKDETVNALAKSRQRGDVTRWARADLMVTIRGTAQRDSIRWGVTAWDLAAHSAYEQRTVYAGRVSAGAPAANVDSLTRAVAAALCACTASSSGLCASACRTAWSRLKVSARTTGLTVNVSNNSAAGMIR